MNMKQAMTIVMATVALASRVDTTAAQDRIKVAIGGQRGVGETFPAELGQNAGIFKKHGLELELLYTESSGDTMQAVISRSVQVGVGAGFTGTMGPFSKGAPVRIIGATFSGGSQLYWYVRSDSPIQSVRDTKAKTVAYSSTGSSAHSSVLALLKFSGVKFKPTPTGSSPSTYAAVMSGQVDVGWAGAPFGLEQLEKGQIRLVWKANAAPDMDKQTLRVMIGHADDLKAKPEIYEHFLSAYEETIDWVYTSQDGLLAYAKWAGLSEAAAKRAMDEFLPRTALEPRRIVGIEEALNDAVAFKYTAERLTPGQVEELIRIPKRN
jgi:NitT/TauT family transport system substrate-binding protein